MTGIDYSDIKRAYKMESLQAGGTKRYVKYSEKPLIEPTLSVEKQMMKKPGETLKKKSKITPLRLFLAFAMVAFLMTIWVWETTFVRQGLMEVERLKDQKMEIEKTNEAIQTEITKLSNYDRISKIATEKLRMIPAKEKPGVIFMDADKAGWIDKKNE